MFLFYLFVQNNVMGYCIYCAKPEEDPILCQNGSPQAAILQIRCVISVCLSEGGAMHAPPAVSN